LRLLELRAAVNDDERMRNWILGAQPLQAGRLPHVYRDVFDPGGQSVPWPVVELLFDSDDDPALVSDPATGELVAYPA
jgi:hypothetical protein